MDRTVVVLKNLRQSEIGWFQSPRTAHRETARQRALGLDATFVRDTFGVDEAGSVLLRAHWFDGHQQREDTRPISRNAKNWRLEGSTVQGSRFSLAGDGDVLLLGFVQDADRWHVYFELFMRSEIAHEALLAQCRKLLPPDQSMVVLSAEDARALVGDAARLSTIAEALLPRIAEPYRLTAPPHPKRAAERVERRTRDGTNEPDARGLLEAIRAAGYTAEQAIADLVDNAISAGASKVTFRLVRDNTEIVRVAILDDGRGMDAATLERAMRFGGEMLRDERSLGRFGVGLKQAALSLGRTLTVLSRTSSGLVARRWTVEGIEAGWQLETLSANETAELERSLAPCEIAEHYGTAVVVDRIDRLPLSALDNAAADRDFNLLIHRIQLHLGLCFHRFCPNRVALWFEQQRVHQPRRVLPQQIAPRDPFGYPRAGAKGFPAVFSLKSSAGTRFDLQAHVWPKNTGLAGFELDGPERRHGFYVYRNDRLLQAGGWCGLPYEADASTKLARISMDLPPSLEQEFGLDVRKSGVRVPPWFERRLLECVSNNGQRFVDYLEAARTALRARSSAPRDEAVYVPTLGLDEAVVSALRDAREREQTAVEVEIGWGELPESDVLTVRSDTRTILLNTRYRQQLDGPQGALVKVLLFMLVEPELERVRSTSDSRARLQEINATIRAVLAATRTR